MRDWAPPIEFSRDFSDAGDFDDAGDFSVEEDYFAATSAQDPSIGLADDSYWAPPDGFSRDMNVHFNKSKDPRGLIGPEYRSPYSVNQPSPLRQMQIVPGPTDILDQKTALNGCKDVAQALLDHGVDFETADSIGKAAEKKHMDDIQTLMAHVSNHLRDLTLSGAFVLCVASVNYTGAKFLLGCGADINNEVCKYVVWNAAIKSGDVEMIKFLIVRNANVHEMDEGGNTTLMRAAMMGQEEIAQLFLDKGVDIHAKSKEGKTALLLSKNVDMIELLVEHGSDINANDNIGETALMKAVYREDGDEIAKFLIRSGADVDKASSCGNTALMLAAVLGKQQIATILVQEGADLDARNVAGCTALMLASLMNNSEIASMLVEKGAEIDAKDNYGNTALMLAALGDMIMSKILIKGGAEIDSRNEIGNTALMIAALDENLPVVLVLLDSGADANVQNQGGETALTLVAAKGSNSTASFLLQNGADRCLRNIQDEDAYTIASLFHNTEVADLLRPATSSMEVAKSMDSPEQSIELED